MLALRQQSINSFLRVKSVATPLWKPCFGPPLEKFMVPPLSLIKVRDSFFIEDVDVVTAE